MALQRIWHTPYKSNNRNCSLFECKIYIILDWSKYLTTKILFTWTRLGWFISLNIRASLKNSSLAFSYPPCSILSFRNCLIATSTLPCHLPWANIILINVRTYNTLNMVFCICTFSKNKMLPFNTIPKFPRPSSVPMSSSVLGISHFPPASAISLLDRGFMHTSVSNHANPFWCAFLHASTNSCKLPNLWL